MGEQPFRPVGEDRYGGGRKERSGGSTLETKKTGASEAKTPSRGHETPVPKYVEGTIKELEKSDPGKAEELRDYLNGVTDAATDLLNADRIGNAFAYADVLAVLGGRIAPAMLGERDPVNSGDSQVDARLRRETASVMQMFERIGRKLFPEVVKPRNATESIKLLDQVVADLSKIEVGANAFYGMDKIDWSSSAPADMIWELQTRSEQLSETMFNVTNVESIDETRGFGAPRPADMVVMGRALFSVKGVIEQIKKSEYGRSDVTAEEMAAMDAVKGKIGGAGSPVDRTLGSRARAARERLRTASTGREAEARVPSFAEIKQRLEAADFERDTDMETVRDIKRLIGETEKRVILDHILAELRRRIETSKALFKGKSVIEARWLGNVLGVNPGSKREYQLPATAKEGRIMHPDVLNQMPLVDYVKRYFDYDLRKSELAEDLERYTSIFRSPDAG